MTEIKLPKRERSKFAGSIERTFGDFYCLGCHKAVLAHSAVSGVQHRNHCPYCLASRHLDLFVAGDRLATCRAIMPAVGVTVKQTRKKYPAHAQGELMLIHLCAGCGHISINRLAADDDPQRVLALLTEGLDAHLAARLHSQSIAPLRRQDAPLVRKQLYGDVGG